MLFQDDVVTTLKTEDGDMSQAITLEIVSPSMLQNLPDVVEGCDESTASVKINNDDDEDEDMADITSSSGLAGVKFTCRYCKKPQPSKSYLEQHENNHKNIKPYQCDECNYKTSFRKTLAYHRRTNHSTGTKKMFKCKTCNFHAGNWKSLNEHEKLTHSNSYYKCPTCGFMTKLYTSYKLHILEHTQPGKKVKCEKCEYQTFDVKEMETHLKVHECNEYFQCSYCTFITEDSTIMSQHITNAHNETMEIMDAENVDEEKDEKTLDLTEATSAITSTTNELDDTDINKSEYFEAETELFEYKEESGVKKVSPSILKNVKLSPIKNKKALFSGDYSDSSNAKRRVFTCNVCDYHCTKKKYLEKHTNKHEETANETSGLYECYTCKHTEKTYEDLIEHKKDHENQKKFQCEQCSIKFATSAALSAHIRSAHADSEEVTDSDEYESSRRRRSSKAKTDTAWICIELEEVWRTWKN